MTTFSVKVNNLSPSTTQATLEHFFSFCGKIDSISRTDPATSATINFSKQSATKTCLLLNGATLDNSTIQVTSLEGETIGLAGQAAEAPHTEALAEGEEVEQEDKPHAAKMSEFLANGYLLSDLAVEKAIEADKQYGISTRFLSIFNPLATKVTTVAQPHIDNASEKVKKLDEEQGLSLKALAAHTVGRHYYTQALSSSLGARVHAFYTSTSKQLADVHEEALRIKEAKKVAASSTSTAAVGGETTAATSSVSEKVDLKA